MMKSKACLLQKHSSGGVCKKAAIEHFSIPTRKYLCHSLFFNEVAGLTQKQVYRSKISVKEIQVATHYLLQSSTNRNVKAEIYKEKNSQLMSKYWERWLSKGTFVSLFTCAKCSL